MFRGVDSTAIPEIGGLTLDNVGFGVIAQQFPPGDANLDGVVDDVDFQFLKNHFGSRGDWSDGDFNSDGIFGLTDFSSLKDSYLQTNVVPEPAGLNSSICGVVMVTAWTAISFSRTA